MSDQIASESAPPKRSSSTGRLIKILVVILLGKLAFDLFIPSKNDAFTFDSFEAEQKLIDTPEPIKYLEELWSSGKISQRRFVVTSLRNQATNEENGSYRELLLNRCLSEGISDPDIQLRELLLSATARIHSSLLDDFRYSKDGDTNVKKEALVEFEEKYLIPSCLIQLEDFDPVVNSMGIRYARGLENRMPLVEKVSGLLDQPNTELLSQAAGFLRLVTGENQGILFKELPEKGDVREVPGIKEKISKWESTIEEKHDEYLNAFNGIKPFKKSPIHLSHDYMDLRGKTMSGESFKLKDFTGKIVVLSFWATWCTPCADELPILDKLQKDNGDSLKILAVSLDGVPSIHGIKDEEGNTIDDSSGNTSQNRMKIENMLEKLKIDLDVVWDVNNELAPRYDGGDLPTHAIYDATGHLVRVFGGSRSKNAWDNILEGIKQIPPAH